MTMLPSFLVLLRRLSFRNIALKPAECHAVLLRRKVKATVHRAKTSRHVRATARESLARAIRSYCISVLAHALQSLGVSELLEIQVRVDTHEVPDAIHVVRHEDVLVRFAGEAGEESERNDEEYA